MTSASASTSTSVGIVVEMLRRIIIGDHTVTTTVTTRTTTNTNTNDCIHNGNDDESSPATARSRSRALPVWVAVPPETQLLLQNLVLQTDGHGNTPLHWSAFKNSVDCLALLLLSSSNSNSSKHNNPANSNVNVRSSQSGWTPLHDAAYSNAAECIELLLQHGADVNACSNSGATPLCFAAQEDASHAVECLLRYGADARRDCSYSDVSHAGLHHARLHRFSGYTPLHYAAHYNASNSARALLLHVHVLHSNGNGNGNVMKVRKELLSAMDVGGRMPIQVAAARGSSDVLRELLAAGAPLHTNHSHSLYNHHTLHSAEQHYVDVVHDLLRHGNHNHNHNRSNISLTAAIPRQPIRSSKPWNCLAQRNIDECFLLLQAAEAGWTPESHCIFTPRDRRCVDVIWMCGKFRAVYGEVRMCMDLWRLVLGFCRRGWFDHVIDHDVDSGTVSSSSSSSLNYQHHQDDGSQPQPMELL